MATRKTNNGGNKKSTGTRKSTTTKRKTSTSGRKTSTTSRKTSTGRAATTSPTIIRAPREGDSTAYRIFYIVITVAIVVGLFAWQNGYLDRFLMGTPLEQYAVGTGSGDVATGVSPDYADIDTNWDETVAPNYYQVIGEAHTEHEDELERGQIVYVGLDELGRTREAYGKLTSEMYEASKGWRADWEAGTDKVSGWGHNRKVEYTRSDGKTITIDAFNRSHLIADSIGGASNIKNVITGTRMQNTAEDNKGGMCYTETIARDWFEAHKGDKENYIYYCAYPVYVGDEIVPRLVVVDIKTSTGDVSERVVTYNYMKGFRVEYNTGELLDE